jgi:hypothetical protein
LRTANWLPLLDILIYEKLNELLDAERFDGFVEALCARYDAPQSGRPSLLTGNYFRSLRMWLFLGIIAAWLHGFRKQQKRKCRH